MPEPEPNAWTEQASKALSIERDLASITGRLEAVVADKDRADRARRDLEDARRAVAAVLDDLADLASDALPPPLPPAPPVSPAQAGLPPAASIDSEGAAGDVGGCCWDNGGVTAAREEEDVGGGGASRATPAAAATTMTATSRRRSETRVGAGSGGRRGENGGGVVAKLAELEGELRARFEGQGKRHAAIGGKEGGGGGRERERCLLQGKGEVRRVVRTVRGLAAAGGKAAAERDCAVHEVCDFF